MSEQIAAAAAPIISAAVKTLTPEAEAALREVHDFASAEYAKFDADFPKLVQAAETDARGALATAADPLLRVIAAIGEKLGRGPTPAASGVDPSSAAPAPQA